MGKAFPQVGVCVLDLGERRFERRDPRDERRVDAVDHGERRARRASRGASSSRSDARAAPAIACQFTNRSTRKPARLVCQTTSARGAAVPRGASGSSTALVDDVEHHAVVGDKDAIGSSATIIPAAAGDVTTVAPSGPSCASSDAAGRAPEQHGTLGTRAARPGRRRARRRPSADRRSRQWASGRW